MNSNRREERAPETSPQNTKGERALEKIEEMWDRTLASGDDLHWTDSFNPTGQLQIAKVENTGRTRRRRKGKSF